MATLGISCSICLNFYKNSDEIYSTNCGHVFHAKCIQEWRIKSINCPVCRSLSSIGHKIYLKFEGLPSDNEKEVSELKSQLKESVSNASVLQKNFDDSQREFLKIQKLCSEYKTRMLQLNKQNESLTLQNDAHIKNIESKAIENNRLQEALNASNPEGSCKVLQEEVNVLKEKLQTLSLELNKQIRDSTELVVDKAKLQSMLDHTTKLLEIAKKEKKKCEAQSKQAEGTEKVTYIPLNLSTNTYKGCTQSVIIKNVRGAFFDKSYVLNYIGKLIRVMSVNLSISDIDKISVLEGRKSETMSLIIKFKTMNAKKIFLTRSNILRMFEGFKNLVLHEYVDDDVNSLFHQAKCLRSLGYQYIYCRNNKVYVKKHEKAVAEIIEKKEDIEELKKKAEADKPDELSYLFPHLKPRRR